MPDEKHVAGSISISSTAEFRMARHFEGLLFAIAFAAHFSSNIRIHKVNKLCHFLVQYPHNSNTKPSKKFPSSQYANHFTGMVVHHGKPFGPKLRCLNIALQIARGIPTARSS